jgi:hypothetical protein
MGMHHPKVDCDVQAVATQTMHHLYPTWCDDAGKGGVVRLSVLGATYCVLLTPAAAAAVLRKQPYIPKPAAPYNVFAMFVCSGPSLASVLACYVM